MVIYVEVAKGGRNNLKYRLKCSCWCMLRKENNYCIKSTYGMKG